MVYKKYTEQQRASITAFAISCGYPNRHGSVSYVQKLTKVGNNQIHNWYKEQDKFCGGKEVVKAKMIELEELLEQELSGVFKEMLNKRENASYKDLIVGVGVMTDKLLALRGKASNITENRVSTWQEIVNAEKQKYNPVEETKGE
jgi:hypothetical protein